MNTSADKLTETFNKFNFPEIFSNLVYYEPWDVYHWVFNERCSAIVKDNIKDAFANINRCIRCAEKQKPGPGAVSFKEPYCIGCKARVLAEEQLWISDMKKKKKLEEEEAEGGSTSRKSRAPLPQSYEEGR
jgi:hypothetical protein